MLLLTACRMIDNQMFYRAEKVLKEEKPKDDSKVSEKNKLPLRTKLPFYGFHSSRFVITRLIRWHLNFCGEGEIFGFWKLGRSDFLPARRTRCCFRKAKKLRCRAEKVGGEGQEKGGDVVVGRRSW